MVIFLLTILFSWLHASEGDSSKRGFLGRVNDVMRFNTKHKRNASAGTRVLGAVPPSTDSPRHNQPNVRHRREQSADAAARHFFWGMLVAPATSSPSVSPEHALETQQATDFRRQMTRCCSFWLRWCTWSRRTGRRSCSRLWWPTTFTRLRSSPSAFRSSCSCGDARHPSPLRTLLAGLHLLLHGTLTVKHV